MPACFHWTSLALSGSLPVSLWLSMALCNSHSGSHWLSLPLSGILWPSLAHNCSLISRIQPLIGSQGPCLALIANATMTHFIPLCHHHRPHRHHHHHHHHHRHHHHHHPHLLPDQTTIDVNKLKTIEVEDNNLCRRELSKCPKNLCVISAQNCQRGGAFRIPVNSF